MDSQDLRYPIGKYQRPEQLPPDDVSLALLEALHIRWTAFLRGLSAADFQRTFHHPELGDVPLDVALGIYAWHGKHHTAHVTNARQS